MFYGFQESLCIVVVVVMLSVGGGGYIYESAAFYIFFVNFSKIFLKRKGGSECLFSIVSTKVQGNTNLHIQRPVRVSKSLTFVAYSKTARRVFRSLQRVMSL